MRSKQLKMNGEIIMNHKEFCNEVYQYVDDETVTPKQTTDVIESFIEALKEQASKGVDVRISGLGIFKYSVRAARAGRNPSNGKALQVPAKAVVSFKPAKSFKDLMGEVKVD